MDDARFQVRVQTWEALPGDLADANYQGYPHPLDAKLDTLCTLYLDASSAQRQQLAALAVWHATGSREDLVAANNLLAYIRRCGRRVHDTGDTQPLRFAMVAAALAAERVDERDLAVALVFLRAGADRAGISMGEVLRLLDEVSPQHSGESGVPGAALTVRRVITGVWRSDAATITRILAYHVGTG